MTELIIDALEYVLTDVAASGMGRPRVELDDWYDDSKISSAMIYNVEDATGRGVFVRRDLTPGEQVVAVADQVQEWVIEDRRAPESNWPRCPWHPENHPLVAQLAEDRGVWACPASNTPVARIGELHPS